MLGVFLTDMITHFKLHLSRLLTDRIVDRGDPVYHVILRIGSGLHSDFKFAWNDRNGDPLEGHRSDPFLILYYQIGLDNDQGPDSPILLSS
jgi:hypothetical protein